ncbi:MAG: TPM domain-containing protein [Planctomycetes bacterium]|nr:TPM domain-containing protein [Planctomycetota bacterium]
MRLNIVQKMSMFLLIVVVLSSVTVTQGQGRYPAAVDDYVNDFAGVLKQPDAESIRKMFADLEYQTGIEAVVVTINTIAEYPTGDTSIESFATNLFNSWGIGHQKENNGVLILVSVMDRRYRIELGGGYGSHYDSVMQQVIDTKMLPFFKLEDYSRGIFEGSRGVIENITKEVSWFSFYKWHLLIGILIVVCIFAGISCMRKGKKGWGWAFFVAAGLLLLFLLRMAARGRSSSGFGGGSSFGGGASGSW